MTYIRLIFILISALYLSVAAQNYIEKTGQTVVFNLEPGSKAAWNNTISAEKPAVTSLVQKKIAVFPNPGSNTISVRVSRGTGNASVSIIDITGKIIQTLPVDATTDIVSGLSFPNGVYFARLSANNKAQETVRFLIVR